MEATQGVASLCPGLVYGAPLGLLSGCSVFVRVRLEEGGATCGFRDSCLRRNDKGEGETEGPSPRLTETADPLGGTRFRASAEKGDLVLPTDHAADSSAEGASHNSLGQRPRSVDAPQTPSLGGAEQSPILSLPTCNADTPAPFVIPTSQFLGRIEQSESRKDFIRPDSRVSCGWRGRLARVAPRILKPAGKLPDRPSLAPAGLRGNAFESG